MRDSVKLKQDGDAAGRKINVLLRASDSELHNILFIPKDKFSLAAYCNTFTHIMWCETTTIHSYTPETQLIKNINSSEVLS